LLKLRLSHEPFQNLEKQKLTMGKMKIIGMHDKKLTAYNSLPPMVRAEGPSCLGSEYGNEKKDRYMMRFSREFSHLNELQK
jgi:hypothetical protein